MTRHRNGHGNRSAAGGGDRISVTTDGVSGQIVIGNENVTIRSQTSGRAEDRAVTEPDLARWRAEYHRVRALLAELAERGRLADEEHDRAGERLAELEEAVTGEQPDVSTMVAVRNWFARRLPALAGAVTALIAHTVVGELVQAAGDHLAAGLFHREFGGQAQERRDA